MIIKNHAENEAVLSNVGQVGEFRIRNSAKAFGILSSGLYANKIRAIVREYSCNAFDSHTEAGRAPCPFDVHLPNDLEPWFAVRDYGVGLDDQQVTNIFTTYFESTKTETDDLIGGLGLGSKSAFSYTDNFTITAIKANVKRIYTAFINEHGVPSVAMMLEEATEEAAGVEIKFSVNDTYDYRKFREEAEFVYRTFKHKPNVSGVHGFKFPETLYHMKDIIPGVHHVNIGMYGSTAIMGNISYPIEVPNQRSVLGEDLSDMLQCGLEMEFAIGELDIQASREGLSYIPETIAAIKVKLEATRDAMVVRIAADADAIPSEWARAIFIVEQANKSLTGAAANAYIAANPSPLITTAGRYPRLNEIFIKEQDLTSWNMKIRGFNKRPWTDTVRMLKVSDRYNAATTGSDRGWVFMIRNNLRVVVNAVGTAGAIERAKNHFKSGGGDDWMVYVIDPIDKTQPMNTVALNAALHTPPGGLMLTTDLVERPKAVKGVAAPVVTCVMKLQRRNPSGYTWQSRNNDMVWREAGVLSELTALKTYYYVSLKGHAPELTIENIDCDNLVNTLHNTKLSEFAGIEVYGVRKGDQTTVAQLANWVNLEDYIVQVLNSIDSKIVDSVAASELDNSRWMSYNNAIIGKLNAASPYVALVTTLNGMDKKSCNLSSVERVTKLYNDRLTTNADFVSKVKAKMAEFKAIAARYPLLECVSYAAEDAVIEYINVIDTVKGI